MEWKGYRVFHVTRGRVSDLYVLPVTFLCLPRRASVLPTLSTVGLSMPFDKGFRFDSVERQGLRSLLLSFKC